MHILRVILSVLALLVTAVGGVQAAGLVHWNAALVDLIAASGGIFAVFGVTPITLPPTGAKLCAALATMMTLAVAAHASGNIPGGALLFNILAGGGTLLGFMGRFQPPISTPAPPPAA